MRTRPTNKATLPIAIGLVVFSVLAGARAGYGQSLGDIARRERERRASQSSRSTRVLTNEDLKRQRILEPEDRMRFSLPVTTRGIFAEKQEAPIPETNGQTANASVANISDPTHASPAPADLIPRNKTEPPTPALVTEQNSRSAEPLAARKWSTDTPLVSNPTHASPAPADLTHRNKTEPPARPLVTEQTSRVAKIPAVKNWPVNTPLGNVARYYRELKQLREEQFVVKRAVPAAIAPARTAAASSAPSIAPSIERPAPASASRPAGSFTPPSALKKNEPLQLAQPAQKEKPASPELVRVEKGDSLWKIADRLLGHGEEWKKIAAANPEMADPNCILPGQWLRLPAPAPAASAVKRAQQVSVQGGDSLWKLAQAQWGSGQAWSCIAAANPQIEFADLIYPGQVLNIPSSCSEIASAIRPTIP